MVNPDRRHASSIRSVRVRALSLTRSCVHAALALQVEGAKPAAEFFFAFFGFFRFFLPSGMSAHGMMVRSNPIENRLRGPHRLSAFVCSLFVCPSPSRSFARHGCFRNGFQ